MNSNIRIFINESRIRGFFLYFNSRFDEIYSSSLMNKLIFKIIEWLKLVFSRSILGRMSAIKESNEQDFFSESIAVKKMQEIKSFILNKSSKLYEESKLLNIIRKSGPQFKNINSKQLGYILVIAIIFSLFIGMIFKNGISYFSLTIKAGFFLSSIFFILFNSNLNTIIKNSYIYRWLFN